MGARSWLIVLSILSAVGTISIYRSVWNWRHTSTATKASDISPEGGAKLGPLHLRVVGAANNSGDRRQCVKNAFFAAMGWEDSPDGRLMYRKGCNYSCVKDFKGWASSTGCGIEPIIGDLIFHMAWIGPWNELFAPDIEAALNSFLLTQQLDRAHLIFWYFEGTVLAPQFIHRFADYHQIEFRMVNINDLSSGTCAASVPGLWHPKGPIQLATKSDVFRLLVLYKMGGVWLDTDSVLLQDVRPLVEFVGEAGGRFSMTLKNNNAFLTLRQNSTLSKALLDFVCQWPRDGTKSYTQYCAVVGEPCHPEWWFNHGPQQIALRKNLGLVPIPLALLDPANDCWGHGLLSGSGAYRLGGWKLSELLELHRGAFALHTRSYQIKTKDRPLRNDTQFGALFDQIRRMVENGARHSSLVPRGHRTRRQTQFYADLVKRNRFYTPLDPQFTPMPPSTYITIMSVMTRGRPSMALTIDTLSSNGYAKTFRAVTAGTLSASPKWYATWLWHPDSGYLRPATSNVLQVYCIDAFALRPPKDRPALPDFNHCDPRRPGQNWRVENVSSNGVVRIAATNSAGNGLVCLALSPIMNGRYCSAASERGIAWNGTRLHSTACVGVTLQSCAASPATTPIDQQWMISTVQPFGGAQAQKVLRARIK